MNDLWIWIAGLVPGFIGGFALGHLIKSMSARS
jgi:hypothetical protein